jgi:hypothetical protein
MIGADIDRYSIVPRFRKLPEAYEKPVIRQQQFTALKLFEPSLKPHLIQAFNQEG